MDSGFRIAPELTALSKGVPIRIFFTGVYILFTRIEKRKYGTSTR